MSVEETLFTHSKPFFFSCPPKNEILPHPVSAWNIGGVEALSGLRDIAIACVGVFCTFFLDP